ncbi:MAG: 3-dehydroquinate synthase [Pseudomonadota bacterium]
MYSVAVDLGERSYPIQIGAQFFADPQLLRAQLLPWLAGEQVAVITNATIAAHYLPALRVALDGLRVEVIEIGDGEQHKSLTSYTEVMDTLIARRLNRSATIIALGGGVVGDLAGFVAATYQRGVGFVQVPTTLLSQVDSSVGGKTAVNHEGGKNLIGAFYQPAGVLIDTTVLSTLPAREFAAGLAEVVKYGVIYDADFFTWLEANVDALNGQEPQALAYGIRRSCEIKAEVVAEDERESGLRAILNFGHTFGHAIENLSGYGAYLHGEAVAIGMVMALRFSERLHRLDQGHTPRLAQLLGALGLPAKLQGALDREAFKASMGMDKKVVDGRIRFVLADAIGKVSITDHYDDQILNEILDEFNEHLAA